MKHPPTVAAVIIGRNEGDRLIACLGSVKGGADRVVYVDSGSTDGSVEAAEASGSEIVKLDVTVPFTAARARNAGIDALRAVGAPDYVQFIDSDCELRPDWIDVARAFLEDHPQVAIACGRRRERYPEASVYNRLCDREWDTPIGNTRACGGDALMRWSALEQAGGFNPALIAGEEPELCARLRARGWEIWRLDAEMTLHDAAMTHFSQWWKRMRRSGHAAAEGMAMHGGAPERLGVAMVSRAIVWGLALPVLAILAAGMASPWALLLFLAYPAQVIRLGMRGGGDRGAWEEAFFLSLGKFPEVLGVVEYWLRRLLRRPAVLIEYK